MKKIISFVHRSACVALTVSITATAASAAPKGTYAEKYAAIVIDANSGQTLFQQNANARRYPASLTKMMTLYMLFEAMQSGRVSPNTPINVSAFAASRPPTKIGFKPGQSIPAEAAAKALITKSANDVATAIAEYLGGSEKRFAQMMTAKARRLGMMNTNFANASGLPDKNNYSTARDMALLSLALREHYPRQYKLFTTTSFTFRGKTINGHNRLVKNMQGVDGIKTGYTNMSGFNLASSMRMGKKSIVGVVLGGRTAALRDQHMRYLLQTYMAKASTGKTAAPLVASRRFELPEGSQAPVPLAKTTPKNTQQETQVAVIPLPAEDAPVPVAKANIYTARKNQPHEINAPIPVAKATLPSRNKNRVSDREHDAALLAALAAEDFPTNGGAAAANELVANNTRSGSTVDSLTTASISNAKKGWVIQIASTPTTGEANEMLALAKTIGGKKLTKAEPYLQVFEQGEQRFYRARFAGFKSKQSAWDACSALQKSELNCYAIQD